MYYTLHARLKKTEPDYKSDLNLFQTDPVQHDSDQANSGQTNPASSASTLNNPICIENVLTLSPAQWEKQKVSLRFPPYAGLENTIIRSCKAEIYPRYISGSLCIPDRKRLLETPFCFTFYINESSIVFVSEDSVPDRIIETMIHRYESQDMSPELFLYGFFSEFLTDDMELLESYERKLFLLEENAMRGNIHDLMPRLLKNKRELTRLRNYFEQIDDMAGQLQGNVRNYFDPERLQLLQLIGDRACRLQQVAQQSIDYCQTLRDFEQAQSDHKQNKTMQLMTVLTSVFFPLTVITGWYGMNFSHMPELDARFGYPLIIAISLCVIAIEFWILKKRKII